jgi:glycosyl transferase family 87
MMPSGAATRRPVSAVVVIALAVGAIAMLIGYNVKDLCTKHPWDGYQYRTSCYNDVYALYFFRGLHVAPFPYIHGDGKFDNETDSSGNPTEIGDLEYPALTGVFIGILAEMTHDGVSFFRANSIVLAGLGLLTIVLLGLLAGDRRRLFYFAAAPALILYAFHNWDLFAVVLMVTGLLAFRDRADGFAGFWLGLGAAAKVFPGLIIPALLLARRRETGKLPWSMVVGAVSSFAVVNIPFAIIDRAGWWGPWRFQSTRFPNFETSWYNIYRHLSHIGRGAFWGSTYPSLTSYLSAALFAAGVAVLLWRESKRDVFRPYAASLGILLIWLLTAKVYSPQYSLWVLPFFVLVTVPWYGFAAFAITDAAVWFAVSSFFLASPPLSSGGSLGLHLWVLEVLVYLRYLVLIWLIAMSRDARDNIWEPRPAPASPAGVVAAPVEFPA